MNRIRDVPETIYFKTLYVDEDGVLYSKEELKEFEYEKIETIDYKYYNHDKTKRYSQTTKRIRIKRRKAKQLQLF